MRPRRNRRRDGSCRKFRRFWCGRFWCRRFNEFFNRNVEEKENENKKD